MKILLIYATNSGSTLEVANYIADELKAKEVTLKDAREIEPDIIQKFDLIILGSPTWSDGDVHDLFKKLFEKFEGLTFPGKKFAVFALGDSSFQHFCTAADKLERFVKTLKGKLIVETLQINNFYFNQPEEMPKITAWAQKLLSTIS